MTTRSRRSLVLGTLVCVGALVAVVAPATGAGATADPTAFVPGPPACLTTPWLHLNTQKHQNEIQVLSSQLHFTDHTYNLQNRATQPVQLVPVEKWMDACSNLPTQQVLVYNRLNTLTFLDGEMAQFATTTVIHKTGQPWHEVRGVINAKFNSLGGYQLEGFPTTDENRTPNGLGAYNHFDKDNSIYWSPGTGAHEVKGAIRAEWSAIGWENSYLGFPTTDELDTPTKPGRYNHFQDGSIYWSAATGAHAVHGAIRDYWARLGWENGQLGFPTSDEFAIPGGRCSLFEHNCRIDWYSDRGAQAFCANVPPIT